MQLTKSGLISQYRRDPEFRSSVISHAFGLALSTVLAFAPYNIQFTGFICLSTAIFISCYLYKHTFAYSIQAGFLGWVLGSTLSLSVMYYDTLFTFFIRYLLVLSIFHYSEFLFTAITNRRSLRPDSFLLNHSKEYWIAAVLSWLEFTIEANFFPSIKSYWISYVGVLICLLGEFIRKTAMLHAGLGFTHKLALSKRPDHRLVTNGIYAYVRHPGYVGWLLWSIGTQIVLCNPICLVFYAVVSWKFMDNRIYDEEKDLIAFFGEQYVHYQQKTWSGIPFSPGKYQLTFSSQFCTAGNGAHQSVAYIIEKNGHLFGLARVYFKHLPCVSAPFQAHCAVSTQPAQPQLFTFRLYFASQPFGVTYFGLVEAVLKVV